MGASTPESRIKTKVRKVLDDIDVYYFMPVTGGYGNSGVPDFVGCAEGLFFGIETKANGNTPTALQQKHLDDIRLHGGWTMVVDETNVDTFREIFFAVLAKRRLSNGSK